MTHIRRLAMVVAAVAVLGGGGYASAVGIHSMRSSARATVVPPPPRGCDKGKGKHKGCGHPVACQKGHLKACRKNVSDQRKSTPKRSHKHHKPTVKHGH